ncbi:unnamed protein product [Rhodiola kirilowii]
MASSYLAPLHSTGTTRKTRKPLSSTAHTSPMYPWDLAVSSSTGSVHVDDYIIPVKEPSAEFEVVYGAQFANLHIGWNKKPSVVEVFTDLPQEALMVEEFSRLVERIRNSGGRPDRKWPEISRKTQVVIDAVRKSIELGCKLVTL